MGVRGKMAYADYAFYRDNYRGELAEPEFDRWAARASLEIDRATEDRAASAPPAMERALALCCCTLADRLAVWDAQDKATRSGLIASEDVDGYRVSYRQAGTTEKEDTATKRRCEVHSICADHLCAPVNLMYRGVW